MSRWALLGLLGLGWGSAFLFQDVAVEEIGPFTLTAVRLTIAAAAVALGARIAGRRLPRDRRSWAGFAALGVVGNLFPFALATWAQAAVPSSLAGILTATTPLMTLVLARVFAGGEPIGVRRATGFVLGFAGVAILLGPETLIRLELRTGTALAYAALLGGALCFAASAVIASRLPAAPAIVQATGVLVCAAAATTPPALLLEGLHAPRISLDAGGSLAVLALVITPGATWAYFRLVKRAGPAFLSLFNYINPLVAVALGHLVLGERIGARAAAGLAIILAGVALGELGRNRRQIAVLDDEKRPVSRGAGEARME